MSRCTCGRVKSKHSAECNVCHNQHVAAMRAEATSIVALGKCPECGTKLIQSDINANKWRCGAYPRSNSESIIDIAANSEFAGLPGCSFQCFTE